VEIQGFKMKVLTGTLPQFLNAAGHHTHAMKTDGSWWSWGDNSLGQLGIGTLVNKASPVRVNGI
jgi:alpha-tubulin suppressor-like RCC1 family protein